MLSIVNGSVGRGRCGSVFEPRNNAPPSEWVANEMRRDTAQLRENDTFALILDTFYDRRNGVAFYTNALGAIADFALTNESNPNSDWNPVWDVRTARFEGGWTVETGIEEVRQEATAPQRGTEEMESA